MHRKQKNNKQLETIKNKMQTLKNKKNANFENIGNTKHLKTC